MWVKKYVKMREIILKTHYQTDLNSEFKKLISLVFNFQTSYSIVFL